MTIVLLAQCLNQFPHHGQHPELDDGHLIVENAEYFM
jgi:hypothetical protein